MRETKIIINYDRRSLIKSIYQIKNNNFEVVNYESKINQLKVAAGEAFLIYLSIEII